MGAKLGPSLELRSVAELYHKKILGKRLRSALSVRPKKMIDQESTPESKDFLKPPQQQKLNYLSSKTDSNNHRNQKTEKSRSKTSKLTVHKGIQSL
jgi:hypothetical protein